MPSSAALPPPPAPAVPRLDGARPLVRQLAHQEEVSPGLEQRAGKADPPSACGTRTLPACLRPRCLPPSLPLRSFKRESKKLADDLEVGRVGPGLSKHSRCHTDSTAGHAAAAIPPGHHIGQLHLQEDGKDYSNFWAVFSIYALPREASWVSEAAAAAAAPAAAGRGPGVPPVPAGGASMICLLLLCAGHPPVQ